MFRSNRTGSFQFRSDVVKACPSGRTERANMVELTVWTETDDGKDIPRGPAAAGCDHHAHPRADLLHEQGPDSWILPIRRPINGVHRSDFLTGNAHSPQRTATG